jgi:hypothetical protein
MNELVPLLEKLALKLGTTVQYIFSVYIKQAWISGVCNILQYILIVAGCYVWWKYRETWWEPTKKWEEFNKLPWSLVGMVLGVLVIMAFFCIPNTITAFINPEYWALEKIFGALRELK